MKNKKLEIDEKKISRKEAIKKTGYIALSAATMMILLGTPKTASASPPAPRSNPAPPPEKKQSPWGKKN
jgi:hypothetical protein